MIEIGIPLAAAVVSFSFSGFVLARWAKRHGPHNLLWGIGLLLFGLGSLMEVFFQIYGWSELGFRLWYFAGAYFSAAYLGQGTVYLLARKRFAHILTGVLVLGSIVATVVLFRAPVDAQAVIAFGELSGRGLPKNVRLLTIPFNTYGTLGLAGGAIYSAWLFWRKRVLLNRVIGNLLIGLGGLLPAFAGIMARIGIPRSLYVGLLLGSLIMFIGFLQSARPEEAVQRKAATS